MDLKVINPYSQEVHGKIPYDTDATLEKKLVASRAESMISTGRQALASDILTTQGLKIDDIDELSADAFADGCHGTNPIALTKDELAEIYCACL